MKAPKQTFTLRYLQNTTSVVLLLPVESNNICLIITRRLWRRSLGEARRSLPVPEEPQAGERRVQRRGGAGYPHGGYERTYVRPQAAGPEPPDAPGMAPFVTRRYVPAPNHVLFISCILSLVCRRSQRLRLSQTSRMGSMATVLNAETWRQISKKNANVDMHVPCALTPANKQHLNKKLQIWTCAFLLFDAECEQGINEA